MRSAIRLVGLLTLILVPGTAPAADLATCTTYATAATSRAVEDAMAVCGYSGDAWNPRDYIGHLNWCLGASAQTVANESRNRQAAIEKCDKCKGYAKTAVDQQTQNDPNEQMSRTYAPEGSKNQFRRPPMACGYSGDWWSSDFNAHARWCVGVSEEEAQQNTNARAAWLQICETCRDYAHRAVGAYLTIWPKCRHYWANPSMSTARWSTDHKNHFQWCMSLGAYQRPNALSHEHAQRATVVEACNIGQARGPLTIETPATAATPKPVARPKSASTSTSVEGVPRRSSGGVNNAKSSTAKSSTAKPSGVARVNPCKPGQVNDPCKPKTRIINPGLLDGDGGFARQGPSAIGSPIGGGAPSRGGASGASGLR